MTVQQKRKSYQSFPDQPGGSLSFDKLIHLRLPPLEGKSFLDVGCNEGFFCGFARHQGARRSVGIDVSADFVERARIRFPDCEFLRQTWDKLPEEKFDVILLASAIHYAEDQPALIERLLGSLSQNGTLVVELGIVAKSVNEWVPVKRSIDTRYFPTMTKLREVLEPHAWKYVGKSVSQAGDPIPRHVVQIKKRLPVAYLLMMPPSYGKTTVAKGLFPKAGVTVLMGDVLLNDISKGRKNVSKGLSEIVTRHFEAGDVDRAKLIKDIFADNLGDDYITAWAGGESNSDIALDGFIPQQHHDHVAHLLSQLGYFPVQMNWSLTGDPLTSHAAAMERTALYKVALGGRPQSHSDTPVVQAPAAAPRSDKSKGAGFVDKISFDKNEITISGWAFSSDGTAPENYVVNLAGDTFDCSPSEKTRRNDVKRKFGLKDAELGYVIKLALSESQRKNLTGFSIRAAQGKNETGKPFGLSSSSRLALSGQ